MHPAGNEEPIKYSECEGEYVLEMNAGSGYTQSIQHMYRKCT